MRAFVVLLYCFSFCFGASDSIKNVKNADDDMEAIHKEQTKTINQNTALNKELTIKNLESIFLIKQRNRLILNSQKIKGLQ